MSDGHTPAPLRVKEIDGAPSIPNVRVLEVSNGTLTNQGGGVARLNTSGGGGLPSGLTYVSPDLSVGTDVANQAVASGSTANNPVKLAAVGSDSSIDLVLVPKGGGAVESAAAFVSAATAVPTLTNGQFTFTLDEANNEIVVTAKYSNGTTKTGAIALT